MLPEAVAQCATRIAHSTIRFYQILALSPKGLTIPSPSLHPNACANSGMFDSGPITRNFAIGCGSPCTIKRYCSIRIASLRNWPHAMKNY